MFVFLTQRVEFHKLTIYFSFQYIQREKESIILQAN